MPRASLSCALRATNGSKTSASEATPQPWLSPPRHKKDSVTFRKYLVLAGVTLFAAIGDTFLARGMKQVGNVSLHGLPDILFSILNPWVALGIFFLLGFFAAYMMALSWADLTYVLPATSLVYVFLTLIPKFLPHERFISIAVP